MAGLSAGAAARTAAHVRGRDVLAIQDTCEIMVGGGKLRRQGFGPVGKGGATGGVLLHPVLAIDAASGVLLGLADISVWNRDTGKAGPRAERGLADKESMRWLNGAQQAGAVLAGAARITVVSDRESDIYADFAGRPDNVHLLIRAWHNRPIVGDTLLFDHADGLKEASRMVVDIAAAPGRPARKAHLAMRFSAVEIRRPKHGMPAAELKALPQTIKLHLIDIREVDAPTGIAPIHWRLLTSHEVKDVAMARMMLDFYRKRWIIEEYFRTLKSAGFEIDEADVGNPQVMMKLVALASIAAVTVTQLLRARDNPDGQSLLNAFGEGESEMIEAINRDYEGPHPTPRQKNPHPRGTMAYATWVIARLGSWTGYYGKPGPRVIARGLQQFNAIKYGAELAK